MRGICPGGICHRGYLSMGYMSWGYLSWGYLSWGVFVWGVLVWGVLSGGYMSRTFISTEGLVNAVLSNFWRSFACWLLLSAFVCSCPVLLVSFDIDQIVFPYFCSFILYSQSTCLDLSNSLMHLLHQYAPVSLCVHQDKIDGGVSRFSFDMTQTLPLVLAWMDLLDKISCSELH